MNRMTFVGDYSFREKVGDKIYLLQVKDGNISVLELDMGQALHPKTTHSWVSIADLFNSVEEANDDNC